MTQGSATTEPNSAVFEEVDDPDDTTKPKWMVTGITKVRVFWRVQFTPSADEYPLNRFPDRTNRTQARGREETA